MEALKGVLEQNGISYVIVGEYVRSIAGLAEKKEGYPLSGWLFRINGNFPGVGAGSAIIGNGDRLEWLYTLDGGKDVGATVLTDNKTPELKPEPEPIKEVMNIVSQHEHQLIELKEVKQLPQVLFPDLAGFDWAREAIESLAAKGIIKGHW